MAEPTISELKSLGPKSQEILARVGITTAAQLREVGSVGAYALAKKADHRVSLSLLWGLESALTGEHWQLVARKHRASLLLALEEHQSNASDWSFNATVTCRGDNPAPGAARQLKR